MSPLPPTLMDQYRERLAIPGPEDGGPNDIRDEMPYLLERAWKCTAPRILEIGVRSGNSTSAFLAACARTPAGHLYSVDINPPQVPEQWARCGYWSFERCASEDAVPELLGWPLSYDIVFLDGDHSRAATLAALRKWVPYVAAGGVALCHDTKLVNEQAFGMPREVAQALDEFCAEYHLHGRSLPWRNGIQVPPRPLAWTERGGHYGLGVIEDPNGGCS